MDKQYSQILLVETMVATVFDGVDISNLFEAYENFSSCTGTNLVAADSNQTFPYCCSESIYELWYYSTKIG